MRFFREFKEFALKGNLIDIAVGFVMGAAFTKVSTAFINGMVMPVISLIQGKDFSSWAITIKEAGVDSSGKATEPVMVHYGTFLSVTIEFIMVAFFMFLLIRMMNAFRKKEQAPAAVPLSPPPQEVLLTEIRDLLRKEKNS